MNALMNRRGFLTGMLAAGGAAITLPLPRLAAHLNGNGTAFADGSKLPHRFGLWFFGNGTDPGTWHPAGSGGSDDQWALTEQLAPLAAVKSHLTVLSNIEVRTGNAHVGGTAGAVTGAPNDNLGSAMLPSIDQVVAQVIGANTPFRSIEVGLSKATPAGSEVLLHTVSHGGPAAPNYPEFDPHRLFARLFGISATTPELREARRSVLDAVKEDFNDLRSRVGSADRMRLEAHADGIRALEQRLVGTPRSCGLIEAPGADVQADTREEAPAILNDVMGRLIAMALACDLTNVFSYVFTLPAGHVYYRHLGEEFNRSFHEDIVHLVDGLPNGYQLVRRGIVYTMECFANHLAHLHNTTTPTGTTLLDEICVLCTSEVSYGWTHAMTDHPVLLAGKACGRLRGNLHWTASGQQNISRVLLTVAQLMGAQIDSLGRDVGYTNQPINDILA